MKFCVIGLGRFGRQISISLAEKGQDVLAIDKDENEIFTIKNLVSESLCTEIIDKFSLEAIGIEDMNVVIVAIGEDVAQSILITALIKKLFKNIKVVARATCATQKEIFMLLQIDEIVCPELDTAIFMANKLVKDENL